MAEAAAGALMVIYLFFGARERKKEKAGGLKVKGVKIIMGLCLLPRWKWGEESCKKYPKTKRFPFVPRDGSGCLLLSNPPCCFNR